MLKKVGVRRSLTIQILSSIRISRRGGWTIIKPSEGIIKRRICSIVESRHRVLQSSVAESNLIFQPGCGFEAIGKISIIGDEYQVNDDTASPVTWQMTSSNHNQLKKNRIMPKLQLQQDGNLKLTWMKWHRWTRTWDLGQSATCFSSKNIIYHLNARTKKCTATSAKQRWWKLFK